jgi:hypothetical protein
MRIARPLKLSFALTLFAVCSAVLAAAQQYEILRADYGYGDQRVDVTQRLREIARSDTRFRMGNSTFGVDPAPGRKKTLRIIARGAYGKTRTFEYQEGSTVDGSQFSGWGSGNWGGGGGGGAYPGGNGGDSGEYMILSARYGTEWNNVDVTQRLRELAQADVRFRMGNSTFGTDPDPGRVKTLRIYARGGNGQERTFEFREGSTVDGSQFRGWGGGEWGQGGWNGGWNGSSGDAGDYVILSARYGTERNNVDVTQRLRELARTDRLFRMGNSTFGTDPDPGRIKVLRIFARESGGRERVFEYREGSTVDGSLFRGWGRGEWGDNNWRGGWNSGQPR